MSRIFTIDEEIWDYLPDTVSEFSDIDSTFNDISTGSNRAPLTTPSAPSSTDSLDIKDQLHAAKKVKLYKPKRKYTKTSWVWQYMIQDNEYDICKVPVINMQNKEICCGQRFLHDGSTGNMANHLRGKHSIYEGINKQPDKSIQLTVPQVMEKAKVKPHKEPRNQEIRQAIAEWITIDNLPINVIQGKGYRKMMTTLDPAFPIPSNKRIKKEINTGYTNAIEELKILLGNTCESASLTTDLWTAKSKHGYIGVAEFGLEGKITCVVTDNGSNMVNAINQWDGVERLPCAAHTLQLSINRAFQKTNIYIKRIKRLVHFFTSSPKQSERLDNAQKECQRHKNTSLQDISDNSSDDSDDDDGTNEQVLNISTNLQEPILRNIADIKTRWNSKYHSWNRLLKLRKAIEWLGATLPLSDNYDDRADGRRLKKRLLLPHEWNLLKQIVDLLEPFEDVTTYFILKFKYAENDEVNDDDLELEQDAPNFQHEESDEESDLSDSDEEDNLELDTPEQSTTHHH
ncbi:unnamed protein product [Rhizophagus irregularis]|nr:unnamed protein product [Rhizophagus irregularis]